MRILFVAMANSIHTARWIGQIADRGWDIHLFASTRSWIEVHPSLRNTTLHHTGFRSPPRSPSGVRFEGAAISWRARDLWRRRVVREEDGLLLDAERLAKTVERLSPDVVHSLEIQHAGYLTLEARRLYQASFPPWVVTNWGSDIYLFGRLPSHARKIREVLEACDYYACECERDVALARSFGFAGTALPVFPNAGGLDLGDIESLRQTGPISQRRGIMLKGYQSWSGRALVGLRALERCAELLEGYEVWIYSANPDVALAGELFEASTGVPVTVLPKHTPHREILARHGRARVSIGLGISDAISTSLLEAIAMGSFPIQSWTACADEWVEDGRTGLLVPPEDPDIVEAAIRRALTDDALVDGATEENLRVVRDRLDLDRLRAQAAEIYELVMTRSGRAQ